MRSWVLSFGLVLTSGAGSLHAQQAPVAPVAPASAVAPPDAASRALKNRTMVCPAFDPAALLMQQRLDQLTAQYNADAKVLADKANPAGRLGAFDTPSVGSIVLGVSDVLVSSAKKTAITWAMDTTEQELCNDKKGHKYIVLPNTCAVAATANVTLPSVSTIGTAFRRDLVALPACRALSDSDFTSGELRVERANPYVIAALLADAYALQVSDSNLAKQIVESLPGAATSATAADLKNGARALAYDVIRPHLVPLLDQIKQCGADSACAAAAANAAFSGAGSQDVLAAIALFNQLKTTYDAMGDAPSPERIVTMLSLVSKIDDSGKIDYLTKLYTSYLAVAKGDYAQATVDLQSLINCGQPDGASAVLCTKLGTLGQVAAAKSQDEVDAALDSFLSPGPQWKRKEQESMISVGAMVGIGGGRDTLKGGGSSVHQWSGGVFLPVGVDFSFPTHSAGLIKHVALFGSVLDLGAVATAGSSGASSGGTTASSSTNFKLSSVVSPGLYLAVGFDAPVRAGLGISRVAEMRKLRTADGTTVNGDATRIQFFVAIDLTLFSR